MVDKYKECPFCHSSLVGAEIPKEDQHLFNDTHFSRLIGIETEIYDGVSYWQCPDCDVVWSRFTGKRVRGVI